MRNPTMLLWSALAAFSAAALAQDSVVRLDPALDAIVPPAAKVEKLAQGLGYVEGPVWDRRGGYLIFSDMRLNVLHKWNPADGKVSVFLERAGFTGQDATGIGPEHTLGKESFYSIGPNGVTLDPQGRVVFCAWGDRQIVRLEKDGRRTVLASHYQNKRLNSPNDIVIKSNGSIYFTDPPSGLRGRDKDPARELPFSGIYLLKDGKLHLLADDLTPNGLALGPGEKYLYVNDSPTHTIRRYELKPDDTVGQGEVLVALNSPRGPGSIKFDEKGNIYCSVAGGIWILSPEGKRLGTIGFPEYISNLGFGDADGKALYATGRTELYRIRLNIPGIRP